MHGAQSEKIELWQVCAIQYSVRAAVSKYKSVKGIRLISLRAYTHNDNNVSWQVDRSQFALLRRACI